MAHQRAVRMSRPAQLGLIALMVAAIVLIVIYAGLRFVRGGSGYQIGVHFPQAYGAGTGDQVFLNGVVIGSVRQITILPDASVDAIIDVFGNTSIPKNAKFTVQSSVTGTSSIAISAPAQQMSA